MKRTENFKTFDYLPEVSCFRICTGYWHDRITRASTGETEETGHEFNVIVESIGRLAAARFRGDAGYGGLQMWAVGAGDPSWDARWDSGLPPVADLSAASLVNEIGRLPLSASADGAAMLFVDREGSPAEGLTNRLLVRRRFGPDDANGEWREFALFGGNAGGARGSGIMINHKIHRIITKTSDMTVERNIIFTFN